MSGGVRGRRQKPPPTRSTEEEFIIAGTYARDFMKKYYGNEKILVAATETYCSEL